MMLLKAFSDLCREELHVLTTTLEWNGMEWTDLFGNWSILEANWVADNKICIGTSSDEWPPPRLYN